MKRILSTCWPLILILITACSGQPTPSEPPPSYTVRGVLRGLPEAGASLPEVLIRHQAIPEFTDADGQIVGMQAMSMPFVIENPALLKGLTPGAEIEIDFEVRFKERKLLWLTGLRPVKTTPVKTTPVETTPVETTPQDSGLAQPPPDPEKLPP